MSRRGAVRIPLPTIAVMLAAGALLLSACASSRPPALNASVSNGAADVPLDAPIDVIATGAVLQRVGLERLDVPATVAELERSESRARLDAALQPDARYRLTAVAQIPSVGLRFPWQVEAARDLILERVFSTVRAPTLVAVAEPIVVRRGEPLELRFSQPLARATASVPGARAHTEITGSDGRLLRVEIEDLAPGHELTLQLANLVGRNGAPAPDRTVALHTPPAVELAAINGTPPDARVPVPLDTHIVLEWNAPVRSVHYRIADTPATWSGAPTTRVELPLTLKQGQSRTIEIDDAVSAEGGWLPTPESLELIAPAPLRLAAFWPTNGATGVSPRADPTFRFTEAIADRAAAEAAISFDPPVAGRFEWLAPDRVHFIPESEFPHEAEIKMSVQAGPGTIRSAAGAYLLEPLAATFQTGKLKMIDVSLGRQTLTLLEDDQPVWSAPVATGVKGADTPPGTYQVQYKMPVARFRGVNPNGSRYDIPDVHWVLAFFEDYTIHGAYWRTTFGRPGSNGCISLTDPNAKIVFDWADVGTRVVVRS